MTALLYSNGSLILYNGALGIDDLDLCDCECGGGDAIDCFTCVTEEGNYEVTLVFSFTGCWATLNGTQGPFTINAHPSESGWCLVSQTLGGACGYGALGMYWTWKSDGTVTLELTDATVSPEVVVATFTGIASSCANMESGITLSGTNGSVSCSIAEI